MIERSAGAEVHRALARQAAVALIGPRQVGKTTLARQMQAQQAGIYLDLESPEDRFKLTSPTLFLDSVADRLVILDEIHRMPDLLPILRGMIDRARQAGRGTGRYLLLGSASIDLMHRSGETLAGRIAYVPMGPFNPQEVVKSSNDQRQLWARGGFPPSYLATTEEASLQWRRDFIQTYLYREVALFSPRVPAEMLGRLWTMLAHHQGALLNAANLAQALGISSQTVQRYLDLLADLLLVRRLPPTLPNVMKRLTRSPKIYLRDSGLVHALLGLPSLEAILGHPVAGLSWEGFVLEALLQSTPSDAQVGFYRTGAGAEMDLVIDFASGKRWAVEIKLSPSQPLSRGVFSAIADLKPDRSFRVSTSEDRFPLAPNLEAIGLRALMEELRAF